VNSFTEAAQNNVGENPFVRPAAVYAVAVVLYIAASIAPFNPVLRGNLKDIVYFVVPAMAGVYAFKHLRARHNTSGSAFVRAFSLGAMLLALAEGAWLVLDILLPGGKAPYPSIADYLFLCGYGFLVLASALLVRFSRGEIIRRLRYFFDALVASVTVVLPIWLFILKPQIAGFSGSGSELLFIVIYPCLDAVILTLLFLSVFSFKKQPWSRTEIFFALAMGTFFLADFLYNQLELTTGYDVTTMSSLVPDLSWMTGYLLMTLAFVSFDAADSAGASDARDTLTFSASRELTWIDVFSPVISLILGTFLVYYSRFWMDDRLTETILLGASAFIISVVLFRNGILILENRTLATIALRDPLTGIFNHRYFQEELDREIERSRREGTIFSVIVIDIDEFAILNNTLGHQAGDGVLMKFGELLASAARRYDTPARLGGDEFGLVLPGADADEAFRLAQRLRESCSSAYKGGFEVTFSAGIAEFPAHGETKEELLRKADTALYWAKYNGKNMATVYDEGLRFLSPDERIEKIKEQAYLNTVKALASAVDTRDQYTQFHSRNVAVLSSLLAQKLGLPKEEVKMVEIAALLHDVGKIGITDNILKKDGPLDETEMAEIREHPVLAARILNSGNLRKLVPWIRSHHERWDGSGYPDGLAGTDIPLQSRIIAVCDAYDAMVSERHYRGALDRETALAIIESEAGKQFDPDIARAFVAMMRESELREQS
jgi:diguanylate cyclase (GGDEF)-like protein/putative nucleotidyltransferase with HDIG domain